MKQKIRINRRQFLTMVSGAWAGTLVPFPMIFLTKHRIATRGATRSNAGSDMQSVLARFNFEKLLALTVIAKTYSLIEKRGKMPPDISTLTLTDPGTYHLLSSGNITGLFLFDSYDIENLLIRCRPECFEDLTALIALDRPGPLDNGMTDDFVARKNGRKRIEYIVPELEPILKETYGILVYQEQVMKIANVLADYTMPEADDFRKAMGKRIPTEVLEHKLRIIKGMAGKGISTNNAKRVFDNIDEYCGYAFRKSNVAKYTLITYNTAYLKAHFSDEFAKAWGNILQISSLSC